VREGGRVVLVTGASGFVGRHIVRALKRNGWVVRQAVRRPAAASDEVMIGSIGPQTDWRAALEGIGAVVHLAARAHQTRAQNEDGLYRAINTEGTLRLARSCVTAGVCRFIQMSTILVNGSTTDGRGPFRVDDRLVPRGVYAISKAEAEIGLKEIALASDMAITIIRPPLIYGPWAHGNFELLTKAVRLGLPLPFGSIRNRRAFLGVSNLASFVANRLDVSGKGLETFLVADDEHVSTPEFVKRIARAVGRTAHLAPFPVPALRGLLRLSGRSEAGDSLIGSMEIDLSRTRSTGWRPQLSLDAGLQMALAPKADDP
jgi:UDP-glucose 4-epimerase